MIKFREIDEFEMECLIPLNEWIACVEVGGLIDYDGYGELATTNQVSDVEIVPSHMKNKPEFPEWCTHICWYNK